MAESPNPLKPPKNEMESQMKLLAGLLLVGGLLYAWQLFSPVPVTPTKPADPAAASKQEASATSKPAAAASSAAATATPVPAKAGEAPAAETVQASAEETVKIQTDSYTVIFSNRGGVVKSWTLAKYFDANRKPLELVNVSGAGKIPPPFVLEFKGQQPSQDLNQVLWVAKKSDDGLGVEFQYVNGPLSAQKKFQFKKASYESAVTTQVMNSGVLLPHRLVWRGGFGDFSVEKYYGQLKNVYWNNNDNKLKTLDASEAKNGPTSLSGPLSFAGIADQYFAAAFLPRNNAQFELTTYSDKLKPANQESGEEPHIGIGGGGEGRNEFDFFAGPKDLELLAKANPRLERIVDWGFFGIIAKPVYLALRWTHDTLTHNWGWAIIVLTILINLALMPLKFSSLKSAKKMQQLAPEIQRINDKYKGMSLTDPRKADQNNEVMELYKKNGVNPLGGCLPMLVQLPFFFAFYTALQIVIDIRGADWLWVTDLSRPETIAIRILPLVLIASQFFMQKMTPPSPGMDPAQQKMMLFMPLALGYMFWFSASGLVLYWLTGNLVGIVQQWATNRLSGPPPAPAVIDVKPVSQKKKR
jgi:YidC/Oxa1 family membrane protein insertase